MNRRNLILGGSAVALAAAGAYAVTRGPSYPDAAARVWSRKSRQADDGLNYLVHNATLAANSHNTQPWLFSGTASQVSIRPDTSRATPVADPDNHHLFASLGAGAENLALAAAADGRSAEIGFDPGAGGEIRIDLTETGGSQRDALFEAITERQCTRSMYSGRGVPSAELAMLEAAARVEGCEVLLITQRPQIDAILELITSANAAQIADPRFVSELKSWLRFNAAHAIRTGDGLYSGCSGNPTLPSWLGSIAFGMAFTAKAENDKIIKQVGSSSGLAVIVSGGDDPAHWVRAGRSYQRFALAATSLGIRHAFLNQPLEVAAFRPELAALLGIGQKRPDLLVRFGYAEPMPRSLRRPVSDVIVNA